MRKGNFKNDQGLIVNWYIEKQIKDPKEWWIRSHCGPGSKDLNYFCECTKTGPDCAKANTEFIHKHQKQLCGGSGFWCWNCGKFYPNNVCMEVFDDEYQCIDGSILTKKQKYFYCGCEAILFKEEQFEEEMP
jgi:hypothetical protein